MKLKNDHRSDMLEFEEKRTLGGNFEENFWALEVKNHPRYRNNLSFNVSEDVKRKNASISLGDVQWFIHTRIEPLVYTVLRFILVRSVYLSNHF